MLKNSTSGIAMLVLIVAALVYATAAEAELVTEGLVGYWSLDADTTDGKDVDDIWGDNEGTIDGDYKKVAGKVGDAMKFDGLTFIDIPGTDSLNFSGAEEMTVAAWVNAANDDPVVGVVAGCCGTIVAQRDQNSWALRYDGRNAGQEMEFIVCPGWTGDGGFGAPTFAEGEWHHLAGVVAGDELQLYADGELLKTIGYGGPMVNAGSETEIGRAGDGGFVGIIDEVLIYDRALSAEEIKQVFKAEGLAVGSKGKLAICWGELKK